ncbi:hypothetical protein OY671_011749, partial [Metschnikowia pulcherrima]
GTKAYTVAEARVLFAAFKEVEIRTILTHGDLSESGAGQRHRGGLLSSARINLKSGETYSAAVPVPEAREGQVSVRVRASVVSAGTERMLVDFAKSSSIGKARKRPDLSRQALQKARRDGISSV